MPHLAINSGPNGAELHPRGAVAPVLEYALADLPRGAPVVVLIHGYRFSPRVAKADPHRHILSLAPRRGCWKALSWPRHLGFGRRSADEGLCIGFGWEGRGTIWQAWRSAVHAGATLADLIAHIQSHRPGPVHLVAHSLGARVALRAMATLPAGSLGRVVLMAAAEFQSTAAAALSAPAGRTAEVLNITSRENLLFDIGLAWLIRPPLRDDGALGHGLWTRADNWLDIQVDTPRTRRALRRLGFRIPPPKLRVCHWWGYLRPGLMLMYRDLIRRPDTISLTRLRETLPGRADTGHGAVRRPRLPRSGISAAS